MNLFLTVIAFNINYIWINRHQTLPPLPRSPIPKLPPGWLIIPRKQICLPSIFPDWQIEAGAICSINQTPPPSVCTCACECPVFPTFANLGLGDDSWGMSYSSFRFGWDILKYEIHRFKNWRCAGSDMGLAAFGRLMVVFTSFSCFLLPVYIKQLFMISFYWFGWIYYGLILWYLPVCDVYFYRV